MNQKFITKDGHTTSADNNNVNCIDAGGHFQQLSVGKRFLDADGRMSKPNITLSDLTIHEAISLMLKNGGSVSFEEIELSVPGSLGRIGGNGGLDDGPGIGGGNGGFDDEPVEVYLPRTFSIKRPIKSFINENTQQETVDGVLCYLITGISADTWSTLDEGGIDNLIFGGTPDAPTLLRTNNMRFEAAYGDELYYMKYKFRSMVAMGGNT